jgi:hypothetical protein
MQREVWSSGYHITPAAALAELEFREIVSAALRDSYRGGRWFESTAAHFNSTGFPLTRTGCGEAGPESHNAVCRP